MGRQNIYTTASVASVAPESMLNDLVEFIIANRQNILPLQKKAEAFKTRFSGHTVISEIVQRLTSLGKDQAYSLIRIPSKTTVLREVVDMTFLPFDLLQIKEVASSYSKTLSLIPELNDKIIVNITDLTRANGEFSDVTQFQWRIVRDFLSRSFYNSTANVWISPALTRYVAKVYSMTIGGDLARKFDLSPMVKSFIQSIFCLYFVGKMTSTANAPVFVKSHIRNLGLVDSQDIVQTFAFVEDVLGHAAPENLEEVFQVIARYGDAKLSSDEGPRLSRAVLNVMFQSLFSESHVSAIALEYPPYFLFLILLALSNIRIGLSIRMKSMHLIPEGKDVMDQVLKSPLFTNGI